MAATTGQVFKRRTSPSFGSRFGHLPIGAVLASTAQCVILPETSELSKVSGSFAISEAATT